MDNKSSAAKRNPRKQTQWEGLFVSEHAWDSYDTVADSQPMLSADEQGAIVDMLIVAGERKCPVFIQIWQDRHFHYHHCTVKDLDSKQWIITYEDSFGMNQLAISAITSIHMLD